ncbi:cation diffusion facilitator family transporter [Catenulispora yoronensis]|uniref:Cation diffusion facilitator family transporter n=1 Tax=Catenulispora yoronensis TaxID=450799 RepID=A0ABP5HAF5_9ACTN
MGAGHDHGTLGASAGSRHAARLRVVVATSAAILLLQIVGGVLSHSLALLADAGHTATDVFGVAMALVAIRYAARPADPERTFGYYRLEILAAAANAILLFAVAVWVTYKAVLRFDEPVEVAGGTMLVIAAIGLAVNLGGLLLLRRGKDESLNIRGAYMEVLADMLGSVAVVVAALLIRLTAWPGWDPLASILIGAMILPRTWLLLREAVNVLLEGTPKGIDLSDVRRHLRATDGVTDVHDLHAWTITSGLPVLSAHIVVEPRVLDGERTGTTLNTLRECLHGHFDVEHSTFQLEPVGYRESDGVCV